MKFHGTVKATQIQIKQILQDEPRNANFAFSSLVKICFSKKME